MRNTKQECSKGVDALKLIDGEYRTLEETYIKYKKLLYSLARKQIHSNGRRGLDLDDLASVGAIGLIKAYNNFEPERGFRFMTYVYPMIQGEISRYARDREHMIKFSKDDLILAKKIFKYEWEDLSIEEIKQKTGEREKRIRAALDILKSFPLSIDQMFNEDESLAVVDRLGYTQDFTDIEIKEFLDQLPDKYRNVLKGMLADKTQTEIGKMMGCSQMHVSRLAKMLPKLYMDYMKGGEVYV